MQGRLLEHKASSWFETGRTGPPRYAFFAVEGDGITASDGFTVSMKAWSYPCADRTAHTVM